MRLFFLGNEREEDRRFGERAHLLSNVRISRFDLQLARARPGDQVRRENRSTFSSDPSKHQSTFAVHWQIHTSTESTVVGNDHRHNEQQRRTDDPARRGYERQRARRRRTKTQNEIGSRNENFQSKISSSNVRSLEILSFRISFRSWNVEKTEPERQTLFFNLFL